ncbi:MAG: UDP-N-acetylmuramoyl-L-alanyl-D-glutamate--2,6-diaminopimelate ligase [Rikenellaceae bacterium]
MKIRYQDTIIETTQPHFDSREVTPGSLFAAIKGVSSDGHQFIDVAIKNGATTIVCQQMPESKVEGVEYIVVDNSATAFAHIVAEYYGNPSHKLKLVGVTGTNGKTTTATLLYDMFTRLGYKVGLISTVIYKVADKEFPSSHTTPDSLKLNALLAQMVEQGCEYCFMEVSSHSIHQNRIEALKFRGGIFTNITHDHLDYHGNFAEYIKVKKHFFDTLPSDAFALYNSDDKNGRIMVQNCKAKKHAFSLNSVADYKCKIIEAHMGSMLLDINNSQVWVRLLGRFNAYNLAGVYGAAIELGTDKEQVLKELSTLESVAGRFDFLISNDGITAIVDYAHTPDALENVLNTINEVKNDSQRVITVVGCGGNRDKTKRPEMALIAASLSDYAILTSDNPRFEEPDAILKDMEEGVINSHFANKYTLITDRKQAIASSLLIAKGVDETFKAKGKGGDIILIAGKGHEPYQEIKGVRTYFNDKEEVEKLFSKR